jgi:hypothetical protein
VNARGGRFVWPLRGRHTDLVQDDTLREGLGFCNEAEKWRTVLVPANVGVRDGADCPDGFGFRMVFFRRPPLSSSGRAVLASIPWTFQSSILKPNRGDNATYWISLPRATGRV